jgi:hypothetical protein
MAAPPTKNFAFIILELYPNLGISPNKITKNCWI